MLFSMFIFVFFGVCMLQQCLAKREYAKNRLPPLRKEHKLEQQSHVELQTQDDSRLFDDGKALKRESEFGRLLQMEME